MDPKSGNSGRRVVVAANEAIAALRAATYLRSNCYDVLTCTSGAELLELAQSQVFDIILAETVATAEAGKSDPVDGLALLALACSPPVVLALDLHNTQAVLDAVQKGAADVIPLPMHEHLDRLNSLRCNGLGLKRSISNSTPVENNTPYCSSESEEFLAVEDNPGRDDELLYLEDLKFEPLDYCIQDEQIVQDGFQCTFSEVDEQVVLLSSPPGLSCVDGNMESCITAMCAEELGCPMPFFNLDIATPHIQQRTRDSTTSSSVPTTSTLDKAAQIETGNEALCVCKEKPDSELPPFDSCNRKQQKPRKKPKVQWTREHDKKIAEAVETLGPKAVPSRILDYMGSCANGINRHTITNQLRKYRRQKYLADTCSHRTMPTNTGCTPMSGAPGFLFPAGSAMCGVTDRIPAHDKQILEQNGVKMLAPWLQSTVLCDNQGHLFLQYAAFPHALCPQIPGKSERAISKEVQKAIKETISKPTAKATFGLSLDCAKMLETLKGVSKDELLNPLVAQAG